MIFPLKVETDVRDRIKIGDFIHLNFQDESMISKIFVVLNENETIGVLNFQNIVNRSSKKYIVRQCKVFAIFRNYILLEIDFYEE